jgi:hypothetical protein
VTPVPRRGQRSPHKIRSDAPEVDGVGRPAHDSSKYFKVRSSAIRFSSSGKLAVSAGRLGMD